MLAVAARGGCDAERARVPARELDLDSSLAGFAASVGLADAYADGIPLTGLPLGGTERGSYFLPAAPGAAGDAFRERLREALREVGNPTAG